MRAWIVDPSAFTPPYDHALCTALAAAGADVTLRTSEFAYGAVPPPDGYAVRHAFYRHARGPAGSPLRRATKLAEHAPDMLALRRAARRSPRPDVIHFQWLGVPPLDAGLLPRRPRVLTAHDLLPREPRPGQLRAHRALLARMDAIVAHSGYGRAQLVDRLGVPADRVEVIPHGAFTHLTTQSHEAPLPAELPADGPPVVLFLGLLRPYKGLGTLIEAWRGMTGAELWIVGRPMMDLAPLRDAAPPGVRWVPRFVSDAELPAFFRRAAIVVLPYSRTERFDQSGVLAAALGFGTPTVLSAIGGFPEVAELGAAALVPPDDPATLHETLRDLLADPARRERLAAGARAAAAGPLSWAEAARRTLALYRQLSP